MTAAEIRREVLRQLQRRGFDGYTPNPPASARDDAPRCIEPDCERLSHQRGKRCSKCGEERREAAERRRKAEWHIRQREKREQEAA